MRYYTADELARMGWHGRSRLHLSRLALVEQLGRDHAEQYPRPYRFCSVPGCLKRSRSLGMCDTDYRRWRAAS